MLENCSKCGLMMKIGKCSSLFAADVRVSDKANKTRYLELFHNIIVQIIDDAENLDAADVQQRLLTPPNLSLV